NKKRPYYTMPAIVPSFTCIRVMNKQGMRLATQDTAKRIANIPGLNKQGMRLALQDTEKKITKKQKDKKKEIK
ncbi:hypothetical protein, partial [Enterococcus faecalis]|uniref:hypothetical protein n=1 Tax=Enterococcus faecalis TaxID=1351 RepID=UPI001EE917AA